ncbi:MAG TPA: hypothetical protein PLR71_06185 [Deltaproteobacteria bacterium]|nr:hypothetical protein [Deltaproteobacteria bacterium]HQI81135.1 hypothetical protein [Deltaproteobacteria bacterium]
MEDHITTTAVQVVDLQGDRQLLIDQGPQEDRLVITGADGRVSLTITVTDSGPVLHLEGAGLMITTDGDLAISAKTLAIHGRDGIALTSGGDAHITVQGDLTSKARIQNITAELGNVNVQANDDVRIDGERILMNC